uniref:Uncharacterized protein n=1 Tax=Glossina austeni TaxID=7395 RepID=A0A1A9UWQ2_GLOAU
MDNLKRKIRNGPCKLLPVATTTQIAICNSISAICDTSFIAIYFAQRTQAQLSFKVTNLSDELLSLHISNHLIQTLLILKRSPRRVIETNLGSRLIPKVMRSQGTVAQYARKIACLSIFKIKLNLMHTVLQQQLLRSLSFYLNMLSKPESLKNIQ